MKSIPIKTYDFKVDFHVGEDDVLETFLDPNENKNISIQKRPATAKTSTWGTPKPISKPFVTKKAKGPKLTIVGTANVDSEAPVQANNPVASNIFHFKSHLPVKKLADNPKLALSMFKKKTLGAKSEQVFQAPPEPFNNTTGFNSFNQAAPGVYYENKNSIYSKPAMNGLNSVKKLTKQGAQDMKARREANALKASGASSGMFQKRLHNAPKRDEEDDDEEGGEGVEEDVKQRPKSAITPGYMKSNKREKVLKPPKKPEFDLDEEENAGAENEDDIENEDNNVKKAKPQPQKGQAKKKMLVKEPEEEEEAPAGDEFNDDNLYKEEEEEVGTQSRNPPPRNIPKEEKAKPMKPLPKRKPKRIGDEDFEEGASVYDENEADFEGGAEPEEDEENLDEENNENNEEENYNENEENNEEEDQAKEEQASQASSSKRRFRSNYANMMSELQGGLLTADAEATFGFQDAEEDFGDQSAPPKKGIKEVSNRLLVKETKEAKSKDILGAGAKGKFVPYEFMNSLDGDTVQQQREKVTKGVTDFLKSADEKRKKQMEMGNQRKNTSDSVKDTNEYSNRMEFLNTRVQAKIAAMRNIIGDSKATTTKQNKILHVEEINSNGSIDDYQDNFEDDM